MEDGFILIHFEKSSDATWMENHLGLKDAVSFLTHSQCTENVIWSLSTCLRSLQIFTTSYFESHLKDKVENCSQIEIYKNEKAYAFLLEIICGLHSPIIGETEVMGQFRASLKEFHSQESDSLHSFFQSLLTDAKKIRTEHLTNMGAQSYGSICRKELEGFQSVHLLGAGKLTQDLLPWFVEFAEVQIYCRNLSRSAHFKETFPKVEIFNWMRETEIETFKSQNIKNILGEEALVIAATITNDELKEWLNHHPHCFTKVIDLRGEYSFTQELLSNLKYSAHEVQVITLDQLFKSVESNQNEMLLKVKTIKEEIQQIAQKAHSKHQTIYRPLGWDEICA